MGEKNLTPAEIEARERLVRGLQGKGAHLSFEDAIRDFPEALRNAKPDNVPYTFWHQIEHIRICQWDILEYVLRPDHVSPDWPRGYWPDPDAEADDSDWQESIDNFYGDRDRFIELVNREDVRVLDPVSHNAGRSILGSALIVIDHNAYHLGEFVMGRQILGAWESALT